MSQIYKDGSTGPSPPEVATQFTADDATVAVPSSNNLNVFSRDTTDNNDEGIQTTTDANGSENHYTELTNRETATLTTSNATPTTLLTFAIPAVAGTYYAYGNVQAYTDVGPAGGAYSFSGGYLTDGATATELGTEFHDTFQSVALLASDIDLSVSGNNIILTATGVAGLTINWNALFEYRQVN